MIEEWFKSDSGSLLKFILTVVNQSFLTDAVLFEAASYQHFRAIS